MALVLRAGIDHRKRVPADNVAVGAVKRQRPGIWGRYPQDVPGNGHGFAMGGLEGLVKLRFGHAVSGLGLDPACHAGAGCPLWMVLDLGRTVLLSAR